MNLRTIYDEAVIRRQSVRPDWIVYGDKSGISIELAHPEIKTPREALDVRLAAISNMHLRTDLIPSSWTVIDLRPEFTRGHDFHRLSQFKVEANSGYKIVDA